MIIIVKITLSDELRIKINEIIIKVNNIISDI